MKKAWIRFLGAWTFLTRLPSLPLSGTAGESGTGAAAPGRVSTAGGAAPGPALSAGADSPDPRTFRSTGPSIGVEFFSLVGLLVGGAGAGVFWLADVWLPVQAAVLLAMAVTALITGALHEDGWADVCDGFGAGWNREAILAIMRDSRIGTYGVLGLLFLFGLKYISLVEMQRELAPFALIAGHAASRFFAAQLVLTTDYARGQDPRGLKFADVPARWGAVSLNLGAALIPFALFGRAECLAPLPFLWLLQALMRRTFIKRLGGYTGDCAGAVQQVTEAGFYFALLLY